MIVAHDGAAWLPRMAEALLGQTRPVQRVIAVDTGSRDRSGSVLAGLLGRSVVFGMDRATGYGAAVGQALRHRAANTHVPGPAGLPQGERVEWVWLLHDDCEPAPDALEQLLAGAAEARSAAVLGPKVMDWADRRVILEAGVSIDRAGRRLTGIEPREVDQGQHDGDRDVVAVSSAGMLVRRDAWDQVGGFDPEMILFREDVDFCWRIHAAGYRVRVVTDAVVYHLEASARNRRVASAAPRPERVDRQNALVTLLGNLPGGTAVSALAGNLILTVLRTLLFLLAKRPSAALDETAAFAWIAGHPLRVLSARRQRAPGRRGAYSGLRADIPPGRSLRRLTEFAAAALSKSGQMDTAGSHHAMDDPNDDDTMLVDTGLTQRILTSPGVLLFTSLTVIAVVAARSLIGSGPLAGGALLPAWGGASGLWQEYLQGFHPTGIGSNGSTPPYVAVLAGLATLLGGKPWLAVDVIMIGCIPIAGLLAFFAARRVTESVPARVWAGAAYALLPVGMGAVAAGRLGAAVAFTLIPLIGVLAARIFTQPKRRAKRAAWATGLMVAIAAAFVPLVWLAAVLAAGAGAIAFGRSRRGILANLGIVALVPPVLLLPWALHVVTHPALIFLEAGQQVPGLASIQLPARSILLLSPGGPGLPPYWVAAGLVVTALTALLLTGRRTLVTVGWCVALLGLLISVVVSRVLVTPDGGGPVIHAWPGISLAVAAAGLLLAATVAAGTLRDHLADGKWRGVQGIGIGLLVLVACSAPLLAAASWLVTGVSGPIGVSAGPVLPAFVSVSSNTGQRSRTLVLRSAHGQLTYSVVRGADPLVGSTELTEPPAARRALDTAVSALIAPSGGDAEDQGKAIAAFDVGYVLLPSPVDGGLARVLDGVPTLRPVSKTSTFELWRVMETAARVRVVQPKGTVVPVAAGKSAVSGAAAPATGGTLVLAEPAGGWTATLDGRTLSPLAAPVGGWAQGFRLPPGGGRLDITHNQTGRDLIVALEALAVLTVAALGLPGARSTAESTAAIADEPEAGRRRAGRAKDRSLPKTQGEPGDRPAERVAPRRARSAPGARPDPVRPGPGHPGPVSRQPGEVDQRDPAVVGRRSASADMRAAPPDLTGAPAGGRGGASWDDGAASWDERPPAGRTGRPSLGHRAPAPADQRGSVPPGSLGGSVPPGSRGGPGDGFGGGSWDERPPAGRRGRPSLGHRAPAPADQRGSVAPGSRGGSVAPGSRGGPGDGFGDAPAGGRRPAAGRAGRPQGDWSDGGLPDAGLTDAGFAGAGFAGSEIAGTGLPDAELPDAGQSTGSRKGGFWGRRGRQARDEDDGPAPDKAGEPSRGRPSRGRQAGGGQAGGGQAGGGQAGGGQAGGGQARGGQARGGQAGGEPSRGRPPGGGQDGGRQARGRTSGGRLADDGTAGGRVPGGRPVVDRPVVDRPVGGGRGRPPVDRRSAPRIQRPDRPPVTRGRLPGDDEALPPLTPLAPLPPPLSPLAPLPPPLPRRGSPQPEDGYPDPDGAPPAWGSEAPQEPGEADW